MNSCFVQHLMIVTITIYTEAQVVPRRGQWEPSGVLTILPASDSRACVSSAHCPSQILAQYLIYF